MREQRVPMQQRVRGWRHEPGQQQVQGQWVPMQQQVRGWRHEPGQQQVQGQPQVLGQRQSRRHSRPQP